MALQTPRIDSPETDSVEMFRAMTAAERLQTAFEMWNSARSILMNILSQTHPEWDGERLTLEVARRLSGESS